MASEKITIRKSATTLTSIVISMLLVMALFFGAYTFFVEVAGTDTFSERPDYQTSYDELNTSLTDLDGNVRAIRGNFSAVYEPEGTTFAVWNSLKGLGSLMKLPITLIDVASDTLSAVLLPIGELAPWWVTTIITLIIVTIILFAIIGAAKGEQRM